MIVFRTAAVVCGAAIVLSLCVDAQQVPLGKQFPRGTVRQLLDLPVGRFRNKLETLPPQSRDRAVAWLGNFHFTTEDLNSLQADRNGGIFYEDNFQLAAPPEAGTQSEPVTANAAVPVSPFPANLKWEMSNMTSDFLFPFFLFPSFGR